MIPSLNLDAHRFPIFVWMIAFASALVAMLERAFTPASATRKPRASSTAMSSATERLLTTALASPSGASFELY